MIEEKRDLRAVEWRDFHFFGAAKPSVAQREWARRNDHQVVAVVDDKTANGVAQVVKMLPAADFIQSVEQHDHLARFEPSRKFISQSVAVGLGHVEIYQRFRDGMIE